jgi:hypothetical protein
MANRWHARRRGWAEHDMLTWEQEDTRRIRDALTQRRQQARLELARWGRSASEARQRDIRRHNVPRLT